MPSLTGPLRSDSRLSCLPLTRPESDCMARGRSGARHDLGMAGWQWASHMGRRWDTKNRPAGEPFWAPSSHRRAHPIADGVVGRLDHGATAKRSTSGRAHGLEQASRRGRKRLCPRQNCGNGRGRVCSKAVGGAQCGLAAGGRACRGEIGREKAAGRYGRYPMIIAGEGEYRWMGSTAGTLVVTFVSLYGRTPYGRCIACIASR